MLIISGSGPLYPTIGEEDQGAGVAGSEPEKSAFNPERDGFMGFCGEFPEGLLLLELPVCSNGVDCC